MKMLHEESFGESGYDNGLGALSGSWSQAEFEEFERNTSSFGEIDDEVWR